MTAAASYIADQSIHITQSASHRLFSTYFRLYSLKRSEFTPFRNMLIIRSKQMMAVPVITVTFLTKPSSCHFHYIYLCGNLLLTEIFMARRGYGNVASIIFKWKYNEMMLSLPTYEHCISFHTKYISNIFYLFQISKNIILRRHFHVEIYTFSLHDFKRVIEMIGCH